MSQIITQAFGTDHIANRRAAGVLAMYGMTFNNPALQQQKNDRGDAELAYQMIGGLFWFGNFFFGLAWLGATSASRKAITYSLFVVSLIPAITFTFILPYRLGLTFQDLNGNPVDAAVHWEPLCCTAILANIIAEVTNSRAKLANVLYWQYFVYAFGFLSTAIPSIPVSPLCAWLAMGAYAFVIDTMDKQYSDAYNGISGSKYSPLAILCIQAACYAGNNGAVIVWGLNRFSFINFSQFVALDGLAQWTAKVVFGFMVVMHMESLSDEKKAN